MALSCNAGSGDAAHLSSISVQASYKSPADFAADPQAPLNPDIKPFAKNGTAPYKISVIQSGDYFFYAETLASIYKGLSELGWVKPFAINEQDKASVPLLLSKMQQSGSFLAFPHELYVDIDWNEDISRLDPLNRVLEGRSDADLVITLGTLAGTFVQKKAADGSLKLPVLVESASDPLGAGIIKSYEDPGYELISASADPGMYARQVRIFHQIVGFKKLGLIYSDTEIGRTYAALAEVREAARDLGFQIVPYTDVLEDPSDEKLIPLAEAKYLAGIESLAPRVDAIYLAIQAGLTNDSLPAIVRAVDKAGIPSFAMEGADLVKRGVLLGESNNVLSVEGLNSARKIPRILSGESPRLQPQKNTHTTHVAINLEAAEAIGFKVPVDLILTADEVFSKTATDTQR